MLRRLGAIGALFLTLIVTASSALACISARPYDANGIFDAYSREQIVGLPEVIVEGVVSPGPSAGREDDPYGLGLAMMRIDKVWKGAALR